MTGFKAGALCLVILQVLYSEAAVDTFCRNDDGNIFCYRLSGGEGTWAEKRAACGGGAENEDLIAIEDAAEMTFLENNLFRLGVVDEHLWIGARQKDAWVRSRDNQAVAGPLTWYDASDETPGNDYAFIEKVDVDSRRFVAAVETGPHAVICEGETPFTGTDGDYQFSGPVGGTKDRHFFVGDTATPSSTWTAAHTVCTGDSWLASIESDEELADLHTLLEAESVTANLWIDVTRVEWSWVSGNGIDNTENGFTGGIPADDGCAYLDADTNVWEVDATCETTARDAICETALDEKAEQVCHAGSCYFVTEALQTWEDGSAKCETGDATLVVIETEAENNWLRANLAMLGLPDPTSMWIGIQEKEEAGAWMMIKDGAVVDTDGDGFTWKGDAPGETEWGVIISPDATWHFSGQAPTEAHNVLCEKGEAIAGAVRAFVIEERHFGVMQAVDAVGTLTWHAAREVCREADAWMASVDSDASLVSIAAKLEVVPAAEYPMWIGLHRNDWEWVNNKPVVFEAWTAAAPTAGCGYLTHTPGAVWSTGDCAATRISLCEKQDTNGGNDDDNGGLSDGEIAAIAVSSTLVVGGAAAGGGYYAYSKSSSGKVDPEQGEGGDGVDYKKEEDEIVEGGEAGDGQPDEQAEAQE